LRSRRLLLVVAPLLLLGLLLGIEEARWLFSSHNLGVVEPGRVYRSGRMRLSQLREAIEKFGLRTVVNLAHHADDPADRAEEALVLGKGLRYVKERWPGNGVVQQKRLRWAVGVLSDPANQPVLVHCVRGSLRTGAAVAAFRILEERWSRERVREEMVRYRYEPAANPDLERRLDEFAASAPGPPETAPVR
jgi:protein tyrosine/serine phosphatase